MLLSSPTSMSEQKLQKTGWGESMLFYSGKTSCIFSFARVAELLSQRVAPIHASTSKIGELSCPTSVRTCASDSASWGKSGGQDGFLWVICSFDRLNRSMTGTHKSAHTRSTHVGELFQVSVPTRALLELGVRASCQS